MGIDWDIKNAKSFGNGLIRISLMDLVKLIATILAISLGWNDLKTRAINNSSKIDSLSTKVSGMEDKIEAVSDKVLVLETVANITRRKVIQLQSEPIFDPDVTKIKVDR